MNSRHSWIAVLVAAIAVRLLTLSAYPLHDTTEARYAEIARLMVVTGDWITPQVELGVPFWAKPPLSIWLSAASFKVFGFTEFAARFPSFLLTVLTTLIVFRLGARLYSEKTAIIACAIVFTSMIGFIAAGAVMTDAALLLTVTLALAAVGMTIEQPGSLWRYGLFAGAGLGLLAKGPVAIVLIGLPVLAWTLWKRELPWLWHSFPWIKGSILTIAIAIPWYWLAEKNSPGFLEYFLVGEHWLRFVDSGWAGDLYGSAHARPRGTIWLYALGGFLPWSLFALHWALQAYRHGDRPSSIAPLDAFLWLWALAPAFFFTFAGNILPAYVLPGLPALALLLGNRLSRRSALVSLPGLAIPAVIAVAATFSLFGAVSGRSQKDLVGQHFEASPGVPLYYYLKVPFSANFYSHGRVGILAAERDLASMVAGGANVRIAIRNKHLNKVPDEIRDCLNLEEQVHRYSVLRPAERCRATRVK